MSHRNKESLIYQATESLKALLKIGESKHLAKQDGSYNNWIYSYATFQTYLKAMIRFVKYCKEQYGCKTLEDCQDYIEEFLTRGCKNGKSYSARTIKSLTPRQVADLLGHSTSQITEMYYVKKDTNRLAGVTDGFEL